MASRHVTENHLYLDERLFTIALNYQCLSTLNLKKAKYLIFNPHQKVNFNLLPSLTLAGQCLEPVSILRYLGMISILVITFPGMIIFIIFVTKLVKLMYYVII